MYCRSVGSDIHAASTGDEAAKVIGWVLMVPGLAWLHERGIRACAKGFKQMQDPAAGSGVIARGGAASFAGLLLGA